MIMMILRLLALRVMQTSFHIHRFHILRVGEEKVEEEEEEEDKRAHARRGFFRELMALGGIYSVWLNHARLVKSSLVFNLFVNG